MAGVAVTEVRDLCAFDPEGVHPLKLSDIGPGEERYQATRNNLLRILAYFFPKKRLTLADIGSFCRIIVAGEDANGLNQSTKAPSVSYMAVLDIIYRAILGITQETPGAKSDSLPPAIPSEQQGLIFTHILTTCEGRSMFRTQNGNFGFVPSAAQKGDIVVVFLGCDNPLVLRLTGFGYRTRYRVVGEAYCDGVMNGETLLGPLPRNQRSLMEDDAETTPFIRNAWKTGELPLEDPRLGDLPLCWKRYRNEEEKFPRTYYMNKDVDGGVMVNNNLRLTSSRLREQGVKVQKFKIIQRCYICLPNLLYLSPRPSTNLSYGPSSMLATVPLRPNRAASPPPVSS